MVGWWFKHICFKIGLAKVAAVVALGWESWDFSAGLLQCFYNDTIDSPMNSGAWICKNSIHKWIHYRNLSCDFWIHSYDNHIMIYIAYFTSEFNITNSEYWILIYFQQWIQNMSSYNEFVHVNSKSIQMNSYHMNLSYEFITCIYMIISHMNSSRP